MSQKFDSLITILNKLDSGETITVHSLMNDLEVSERSVHRYFSTLHVSGFPVYYDRKKGSYRFVEGYSLRRPDISVEETLALALSKRLLKNFGTGMEKSLNDIEQKLSIKKGVEFPRHIVLKAEEPSLAVKDHLSTIHEAIINFQRIEIAYKTLYSDKESVRNVDPYYLFFQDGFWILRGYCQLRKELRTFALDRILSLRILNEQFVPVSISPEEELSGTFGVWLDEKPVNVVLRFDKESIPYIQRKKWHQSQQEKELKDGRLELRFKVNGFEDIKSWIYRWLPHVEVVAPKKLKETVRAELKEAVKRI